MKKIYFLLIALCLFTSVNAQIINFPDPVLKNILVSTNCVDVDHDGIPDSDVDTDNDNEISYDETSVVIDLYLDGNISSLDEISASNFPYLDILSIKNTLLTSINLSEFTELYDVRINNNTLLRALSLDYLSYLNTLDCSNNQLSSIATYYTNNIQNLNCSHNNLNSLNLSILQNLKDFDCSFNTLQILNVASLYYLVSLNCSNNNISNLIVKNGTGVVFSNIEFNANPNLNTICAESNDYTLIQNKLNQYGISASVTLTNSCVTTIPACVPGAICFDDAYFKYYLLSHTTVDANFDGEIQFSEALQITNLTIPMVHSVTGLNYFTNLTNLSIINTQLTGTLNLTSLVNLNTLLLDYNDLLNSLDIHGLANLTTVNINNNSNLTTLYANDLTNLTVIVCTNNTRLSAFQLNNALNLLTADCSDNIIGSLNLSNSTHLTSLNCHNNRISSLLLGSPTNLVDLNFSSNLIAAFNFASYTNLQHLSFAGNYITSFNLIGLNNLQSLDCSSNTLNFLDVSYLPNLKVLNCSYDVLTGLFIKNNSLSADLIDLTLLGNTSLSHICADTVDFPIIQNSLTTAGIGATTTVDSTCDYNNTCGSNIVCINDVNFKNKLIALGVDSNHDTLIQVSEALVVTSLDLSTSTSTITNDIMNLIGINKFTNLQNLNCSGNNINSLDITGLTNLKTLDCSNSKIVTLNLNGLATLETLKCNNNNVENALSLSGLANLKTIDCSYNVIPSLNCSNLAVLTNLNCDNNSITSLNCANATGLITLNCNNNNIISFNLTNLISLETLNGTNNEMTVLDLTNLINLKQINISSSVNIHSFIHPGLINLTNLNFEDSGTLDASSLDFTNMPKLEYLLFSNTHADTTPVINTFDLDVSGLKNLKSVWCEGTYINNLDLSASKELSSLRFNRSTINTLNIKNGTNLPIDSYNTYFQTDYANVNYICVDDSETNYVTNCFYDNYPWHISHPNINTYCTYEPGGNYNTVTGVLRYDYNNNGCDTNDVLLNLSKVRSNIGANVNTTFTNQQGIYSFHTNQNNITVTPVFPNNYFTATPVSQTFNFPLPNTNQIADFCVTANGIHHDLEIVPITTILPKPGLGTQIVLLYRNNGNLPQSGTVNLNFNDTVLDFDSSLPSFNSSNVNSLTWNFSNLMPFETRKIIVNLDVNTPVDNPPVNNGDVLSYFASVSSIQVDENPIDNSIDFKGIVVGSFDPNDKDVVEGSQILISKVGEYLHYVVRFQNTGTAQANNVVVKDMLTSNLDLNTLEMTTASHNCKVNLNAGNKLEFYFEDINLPASSIDESASHGYVAFKIKPNNTVGLGSVMENTASIYFDYNFPIVTNTTSTTVTNALGLNNFEFSNYFGLYPNPVHDVLHISTKESIEVSSINIYNTLGQLVLVIPNAQNTKTVDVSSLTTGNYFIKINSDKGTSNTKFVKN